jgi:hypothetical protein
MEKIDIAFFILLVFGLVSMFNAEFGDLTGDVTAQCYDSDGGNFPNIGGNLLGFDGTSKRDFCVDDNTLSEYFCLDDRSNGLFDVVECQYGCVNENGRSKCLNKNEKVQKDIRFGKCDVSCYSYGTCVPIGTRVVGQFYCDVSEDLELQLLKGDACENNFECRSNLCIAGNCISEIAFNKFLESIEE